MSKSNALLFLIVVLALVNWASGILGSDYKDKDPAMQEDAPANVNSYVLDDICLNELQKQMNLEKHASLVYKQMAAYFSNVNVAKRGFAKLFDHQAKEEHEHFEKFLNYINLRGAAVENFKFKMPPKSTWESTLEALEKAKELENIVYNEIMRIHRIAEKTCKDVHLQNFLENNFIEEQVTSIAQLTKLITILKNAGKAGFGEYTVDRDLLEGKLSLDNL